MILADPRHEPKVRQGVTSEIMGVDGNGYAPFAHRQDLEDFVRLNAGLDGDPPTRLRLGHRRLLPGPIRPRPGDQRRLRGRQQRPAHRRHRLGGRTRRRAGDPGHARHAPRGDAGGRIRRLERAGLSARVVRLHRRAGRPHQRGSRSWAASITRTCATGWATASWIRSARRSRSGGAARARRTSRTSITARPTPARPRRCWRSSTMRGRRGWTSPSTRIRTSGRRPGC